MVKALNTFSDISHSYLQQQRVGIMYYYYFPLILIIGRILLTNILYYNLNGGASGAFWARVHETEKSAPIIIQNTTSSKRSRQPDYTYPNIFSLYGMFV